MFQRIYSYKRDISVTFFRRDAQSLGAFPEQRLVLRPFLGRDVGDVTGEMQMFENLTAEA